MLGELLDAAIGASELDVTQLPTGESMFTVGYWVEGAAGDKLTVDACQHQHGVIVVAGVGKEGGSMDHMLSGTRVYRWTLNPCRMSTDKPGKIARGSILPTKRSLMTCPACGDQQIVFLDQLKYYDKKFTRENPNFKDSWPSPRKKMACKACQQQLGNVVLRKEEPMRMRLIADGDPLSDPVFMDREAPQLATLHQNWAQGPVFEETAHALPRMWAVYDLGATPSDAGPTDPHGAFIDHRANLVGLTIRSLKEAKDTEHPGIKYLWLESAPKDKMAVGHVRRTELLDSSTGEYTRRFKYQAKTRWRERTRTV